MPRIKWVGDGRACHGLYRQTGEVYDDFDDVAAASLVEQGKAVLVDAPQTFVDEEAAPVGRKTRGGEG